MIDVALKEWRLVCDLLLGGELALLLRKGGIHEDSDTGAFEMAHPRMALYPTYDHQDPEMLKPAFWGRLVDDPSPAKVTFRGWAQTARVWVVPSRRAFDRLDDLHPWAAPYVDMRFDYRPDRPLYLVALRAWRLPESQTVAFRGAFAGCRSWVPLEDNEVVEESGSTPAMDEEDLQRIIARVDEAFR